MADRAHFVKIYDTIVKREKENRMLPERLRIQIAAIGNIEGGAR